MIIAAILFFSQAQAQLLNPGFESIDSPGKAANWLPIYLIAIPVDSTCLAFGFDSLSFATTEAHTGSYAFEMRVAGYCTDRYGGNAKMVQYNFDTFADQRIHFTERVYAFTFFYQLFPEMGDEGAVQITLEDEDGLTVANADATFGGATTGWTLATVPLTYYSADTPSYLTLKFLLHTDSVLHYGTRFLVDDIGHAGPTEIATAPISYHYLKCFPVPADDRLYIEMPGKQNAKDVSLTITDALGRTLKRESVTIHRDRLELDVSDLAKGMYFVEVTGGGNTMKGKFLK